MAKILIVDDHPLYSDALESALDLVFDDGRRLSQTAARDQHGAPVGAAGQADVASVFVGGGQLTVEGDVGRVHLDRAGHTGGCQGRVARAGVVTAPEMRGRGRRAARCGG